MKNQGIDHSEALEIVDPEERVQTEHPDSGLTAERSPLHHRRSEERPHPRYVVNIEGTEHPWSSPTITTEEIARLGGWDSSAGVIEIDRDNNEQTLKPGEVVELKPGHGFAKKVRFKRG